MTRHEKQMTAEVTGRFPNEKLDDVLRWLYTLNDSFEGLAPASFNEKYGGKRFKKTVARLKNF